MLNLIKQVQILLIYLKGQMANNVSEFLEVITTKVTTILGDDVKEVYNWAVARPSGFPFCVVMEAGWEGIYADTGRNRRTFRYTIFIFQEVQSDATNPGKDQINGARIMRSLQDKIVEGFDADPTLGGEALLVQPISGTPVELVDRPAKMLSVSVTIACEKLLYR